MERTLSTAFDIGVIFSLRVASEDANAVMSPKHLSSGVLLPPTIKSAMVTLPLLALFLPTTVILLLLLILVLQNIPKLASLPPVLTISPAVIDEVPVSFN